MRPNTPHFEFACRQDSRPGVENLHRFNAGLELPHQIACGDVDQKVYQPGECVGMFIGEQTRR
jgi:hypothetical protein